MPLRDICPADAEEKVYHLFEEKLNPNQRISLDAMDVIAKLVCIDPKKVRAVAGSFEILLYMHSCAPIPSHTKHPKPPRNLR